MSDFRACIEELRDRHSKRCMRSFDKPRRSKQRSCARCARVKVKCSLDVPSCQRCLHRGLCCEYPLKFRLPLQTTIQSDTGETSLSTSPDEAETRSRNLGSISAELTDQSSSYTSSDTKSISSDVEQTGMAGEPGIWQLYPPNLLDQSLPCLELMDICLFPNCNEDSVCDDLPDAFGGSWKFDTIDPQSYGTHVDRCTYQNGLGADDMLLGKDLSPYDPANIPDLQSMPYSFEELEGNNMAIEYGHSITRLSEQPTIDDLLDYARDFLRYLARKDCQLPFVHSQSYSPGDFDVDRSVAISSSSYTTARHISHESNQTLVDEAFHQEQLKEIEESMTRQACRKFHALLTTQHSDWSTWRIAETLRRTIHLVDVVNKLCRYSSQSNTRDNESLDDDFILDLALPSSNLMWKATDAATWDLARRQSSQVVTTRMVLSASTPATGDFEDSSSAVFDESKEFSRLIITTALLQPIGQDITPS
ncbi:hypothetical protein KEM54_006719 [Ascosphaera aggregata]|nr:hypothetical protein KEM54_006719 [Ascosphaera aggregata]